MLEEKTSLKRSRLFPWGTCRSRGRRQFVMVTSAMLEDRLLRRSRSVRPKTSGPPGRRDFSVRQVTFLWQTCRFPFGDGV